MSSRRRRSHPEGDSLAALQRSVESRSGGSFPQVLGPRPLSRLSASGAGRRGPPPGSAGRSRGSEGRGALLCQKEPEWEGCRGRVRPPGLDATWQARGCFATQRVIATAGLCVPRALSEQNGKAVGPRLAPCSVVPGLPALDRGRATAGEGSRKLCSGTNLDTDLTPSTWTRNGSRSKCGTRSCTTCRGRCGDLGLGAGSGARASRASVR